MHLFSSDELVFRISVLHSRCTRWRTAHWIRTFVLNAALVALAIGNSACAPGVAGKPADPKVWYTADSLALRDGEAVSTWPDTSANGHDATATEGN